MNKTMSETLSLTFLGDMSPKKASADEPLVFLHGLGGTTRYWTCMLDRAPLGRPAIFVDLLGFGDSPRPWCRYTVDRHIATLHNSLASLGPITLIGHSLGAALALIYASRYPEQVRSLVLISLPCFHDKKRASKWFRHMPGGWIFTNMVIAALVCMFTRRVIGHLLPLILTDYPREVAEDLVKHNAMSSITSLWNILYRRDLTNDAQEISPNIDVLCIHAIDDDTAPYAETAALVGKMENWKIRQIDGARHHPWLLNTQACLEAIKDFCDRRRAP